MSHWSPFCPPEIPSRSGPVIGRSKRARDQRFGGLYSSPKRSTSSLRLDCVSPCPDTNRPSIVVPRDGRPEPPSVGSGPGSWTGREPWLLCLKMSMIRGSCTATVAVNVSKMVMAKMNQPRPMPSCTTLCSSGMAKMALEVTQSKVSGCKTPTGLECGKTYSHESRWEVHDG